MIMERVVVILARGLIDTWGVLTLDVVGWY
jgi:hypothetical protein